MKPWIYVALVLVTAVVTLAGLLMAGRDVRQVVLSGAISLVVLAIALWVGLRAKARRGRR